MEAVKASDGSIHSQPDPSASAGTPTLRISAARLSRWIFLLSALIACIGWTYIAIDHLLDFSISQQLRESQYGPTSQPVSQHMLDLETAQKHWGRETMFAIACSILFLMAVMMNWALDGRPRRREGLEK